MSDPAATEEGAAAATPEKQSPASSGARQNWTPGVEVISVELPAPPGWAKKFTPKKGGTPGRNEIVFIAPTGEEIKTKRQLELYLKSHTGCPSMSDFDWGTGDTPRRSARISERAKATEASEGQPLKKRGRKSGAKMLETEEKNVGDAEEIPSTNEDGVAAEEKGESSDVDMKEAEGVAEKGEEDVGVAEKEEGGDVAREEAEGGEERGKVDVAAPEQKEDSGNVAIKEAEFGARAKEDAVAADEKEGGHNVVKKETKNASEKAKEAIESGAAMNEQIAKHSENNKKGKEAGVDTDGKMEGKEQPQAVKVDDVEVNNSQTDTIEEHGKAQTKKEERNAHEKDINYKLDVAETLHKEKEGQERRSEMPLVEKEIKPFDILSENGSLKD